MAVPKTTATRCRDRAYKHCTNNPIPTSFFHAQYRLPVILERKEICHVQKKDVGMGLFVQCLYALSLHLVAVVFGTAIPTSLYIFGKCFIYFDDSSSPSLSLLLVVSCICLILPPQTHSP